MELREKALVYVHSITSDLCAAPKKEILNFLL
jgi:hypothetical protein